MCLEVALGIPYTARDHGHFLAGLRVTGLDKAKPETIQPKPSQESLTTEKTESLATTTPAQHETESDVFHPKHSGWPTPSPVKQPDFDQPETAEDKHQKEPLASPAKALPPQPPMNDAGGSTTKTDNTYWKSAPEFVLHFEARMF